MILTRVVEYCIVFIVGNVQDDLEAELLETPEKEPVSHGKSRRNFGTCQLEDSGTQRPALNLME